MTVNNLNASPKSLKPGANKVTITYTGFVTASADNAVALSAGPGNVDVKVVSVTPQSDTYPLASGPLQLTLQITVINSGGGKSQVTIPLSFTTATGIAITRNIVLLY